MLVFWGQVTNSGGQSSICFSRWETHTGWTHPVVTRKRSKQNRWVTSVWPSSPCCCFPQCSVLTSLGISTEMSETLKHVKLQSNGWTSSEWLCHMHVQKCAHKLRTHFHAWPYLHACSHSVCSHALRWDFKHRCWDYAAVFFNFKDAGTLCSVEATCWQAAFDEQLFTTM